jgi:cytosine/adenosine deaminase-related metal-dependent hydrolase
MPTLLVRSAEVLAQMDDARTELADAGMFIRDGWIEQVGPTSMLPTTADEVVDLSGHVVLPGLVNTHHHLYQTLTRALPAAQDAGLFDWLRALYPVWARMTPDHVKVSTRLGLVELAMSGCTTAFDHHYLWPGATSLADQFEGADPVGIRFHASRGSMSLGESRGGLPPDSVVEDESAILADSDDAIARFHQPEPGGMKRVVLAPCSPFSVTTDLMRESATLARQRHVTLHTHLAETRDEEAFCRDRFGVRPVELMEQLGWTGPDVWYAHAVHVDQAEVDRMAAAGTGVAHCPTSNMRLASGTAPLARYLRQGVKVGLGVDGSASNDTSNLLAEVRQAMLLARLAAAGDGEALLEARTALAVATRGGAAVLGRDDIGSLEPGKAADFIAIDLNRIEFAGSLHDPVAAVVFCAPFRVDHSWVHGQRVVEEGRPVRVELPALIEQHNRMAAVLRA